MERDLLEKLRSVDTPTICNAIEVAEGRRGFDAFTKASMHSSDPGSGAIVGFAVTARVSAAAPPSEPPDVIRERRMAYYAAMAEAPSSGALPSSRISTGRARSAPGGARSIRRSTRDLGSLGAVTNGLMRDLDALAPGFPVIAGGVGPSHAHVHVREIGGPVSVFGMQVQEGDLIHADRHGACVIPPGILPDLSAAIDKMIASEALVLGPAREAGFNLEKLKKAWAAFEAART